MPYTIADIQAWLAANPNATPTQIAATAFQAGVTPAQIAQATGYSAASVEQVWNGTGIPTESAAAATVAQYSDNETLTVRQQRQLTEARKQVALEAMSLPELQAELARIEDANYIADRSQDTSALQRVISQKQAVATLANPNSTPAQVWSAKNTVNPVTIDKIDQSTGEYVNPNASDILALANANALQNTPEWQAAVTAYNMGDIVPEAYRPLLNQLNGYYTDGAAAPGSLAPTTAGEALGQWARDAEPGGFDKAMGVASALVATAALTAAGMPIPVAAATYGGLSTLGTGGSLTDAARNAITSGAFAWGGQALGDFSKGWLPSGWSDATKNAVSQAFGRAGVGAAASTIAGGSALEGALIGAVMSGAQALLAPYLPPALGGTGGATITDAQLNELVNTPGLTNEQVQGALQAWQQSGTLTPAQSAWANNTINTVSQGAPTDTALTGQHTSVADTTPTVPAPTGTSTPTGISTITEINPATGEPVTTTVPAPTGTSTPTGISTITEINPATGEPVTTTVPGGAGADTSTGGISTITEIDPATGEPVTTTVPGGAGADTLTGGGGNNTIDGGNANDAIHYTEDTQPGGGNSWLDVNGDGKINAGDIIMAGGVATTIGGVIDSITGGGGNDTVTPPTQPGGPAGAPYTGPYAQSGITAVSPAMWNQPLAVDPLTGIVSGYGGPEQTYFAGNRATNFTGQGVYTPPASTATTTGAVAPTTGVATPTWQQTIDSWLAAHPTATATEAQQAATAAGMSYNPVTGVATYQGQTYQPLGAPTTVVTPVTAAMQAQSQPTSGVATIAPATTAIQAQSQPTSGVATIAPTTTAMQAQSQPASSTAMQAQSQPTSSAATIAPTTVPYWVAPSMTSVANAIQQSYGRPATQAELSYWQGQLLSRPTTTSGGTMTTPTQGVLNEIQSGGQSQYQQAAAALTPEQRSGLAVQAYQAYHGQGSFDPLVQQFGQNWSSVLGFPAGSAEQLAAQYGFQPHEVVSGIRDPSTGLPSVITPPTTVAATPAATGGLLSLNGKTVTPPGYAKGGAVHASGLAAMMPHLIKGRGDGLSDEVPAYIDGMGQQEHEPIRVADGEYIIPSDVVSGVGNGSTDAGAKALDALVARIRKERTGSKSPAKKVCAQKIMQSV